MHLKSDLSSERLNSVKTSWGAAPFGERRSAAWKHFHAAEAAHIVKNTAKRNWNSTPHNTCLRDDQEGSGLGRVPRLKNWT